MAPFTGPWAAADRPPRSNPLPGEVSLVRL